MASVNPLLVLDANSQPHISPSVSSRWQFDEGSVQRYVAQRDVVLMSWMEGGQPNVLVPFIDLHSLQETYDPENLKILGSDLASYLKTPSFDLNTRGAYRVYCLRLGDATGAALTLKDATMADVLALAATDAGTYTNKISAEVGSGTVTGKRVTIRFRQEATVLNNLGPAFHLAYTGNATAATLTITRTGDVATRIQTTLTGATDGSIPLDLDLTQSAFASQQQLVTYLNGQNGYRARIDRFAAALLPVAELDAVAGVTIRTPVALVIRYIGAGSAATMTTTATTLTTSVTGQPTHNLNIDLTAAATDTLGELVAYIASLSSQYTCTLGPNADAGAACPSLLTVVTTQDIRTANYSLAAQAGAMDYVATAGLGTIIFAINSLAPRVRASRVPGAVNVPANVAQTFFTGGTNPVPTTGDWLDGLDVVAQEDMVGALMFPVTTDPIIQDAVNAWVSEQHTNYGKSFRSFLAAPDFTSAEDAKELALGLNSTLTALTVQGIVGADGITELMPLYTAAMYCGAAAGAIPTQSVTRLVLRGRALPPRAKYTLAVREDLLANGVAALEDVKSVGVRVALAVTTSLSEDRIDRILSESMSRDVIEQRVRAYVEPLIPHSAIWDFMPTVKGSVYNALTSLEEDGIITKGRDVNGKILPAWLPIQVSIHAGLMKITVHVLIGGEIDHILIIGTIGYQRFELEIPAGA